MDDGIRSREKHSNSFVHRPRRRSLFWLCEKAKPTNTERDVLFGWFGSGENKIRRRKKKTMYHIRTEAIEWSAKRWVRIKNKRRKILLMLFVFLGVPCTRACMSASAPLNYLVHTRFYRCLWYDARRDSCSGAHTLDARINLINMYSTMWLCVHHNAQNALRPVKRREKNVIIYPNLFIKADNVICKWVFSPFAPFAASSFIEHVKVIVCLPFVIAAAI